MLLLAIQQPEFIVSACVLNDVLSVTHRAGLTIWWALRTPQRRGPTGMLDA